MRIKAIIALFALTSSVAMAQKGVEDGSRFGHGQDSINCLNNISLYQEYVKTKNYAEAYTYWQKVFTEAPFARMDTYTNGAKILRSLIAGTKDMTERKKYADELMAVYDQQLQHLEKLNMLIRTPLKSFKVKGTKAHDYITYYPGMDVNKAYELLSEVIAEGKASNDYYIVGDFMKISTQKFKKDEAHREQLIQDYLTASEYINVIAEAAHKSTSAQKDALIKAAATTKENVDAYFINSGAADCEQLESIYAPKIEENKENLEYLKKVVGIMGMLSCNESNAYYTASEYAHKISPTAETAAGCAASYLKRGDMTKCVEYFEQAIELETTDLGKAEYCYKTAIVLNSDKQLGKAKGYITRAISLNGTKGAYYILLANIYAAAPKWTDDPHLNNCKYFVVLDKLYQAKRVDESVAEEVNKMIAAYSTHTPAESDLFFLGYKKGDQVKVGGIINETTTIR